MSGRGRGRFNNRGRGKQAEDYMYYLGSDIVKQAADYETTTDFLFNEIQLNFNNYGYDVVKALRKLEPYDLTPFLPTRTVSTSSDPEVQARENVMYEIEYECGYEAYIRRKLALKANMPEAYAFLWSHCTRGMQLKIEGRSDFSTKIKNDPIELLKTIKQYTFGYQENRYHFAIVYDAFSALFTLKQKKGESLLDYTKRFKAARDVVVFHIGGPLVLHKLVEEMAEYDAKDPAAVQKCREQAFERLMAFHYLTNSDENKYGSLLSTLQFQYSLGNDYYPTTVAAANEVLSRQISFYHRIILYFDGASRNNPRGPAGCGWVLYTMDQRGADDERIAKSEDYLGYNVSNNQAEYQGLINGLHYIDERIECDRLYIRGDSEIVIRQMDGEYQVNSSDLRPYYNEAMDLLRNLSCQLYCVRHISRDRNWEADQLANQAIDENA